MTSPSPASTLRPRARRRTPVPHSSNHTRTVSANHTRTVSANHTRTLSPIPTPHPQRPTSTTSTFPQWSSLQSIASTVLTPASKLPATPNWLADFLTLPPPPPPGRGPTHPRARRRDDEHDRDSSPPPRPPTPTEVSVYILPVTATTTLEGLAIALNTSVERIRRANGLWPGDRPQARKELLVMCEECGVRGIPEELPAAGKQEGGEGEEEEEGGDPHGRQYTPVSTVLLPGLGRVVIAKLLRSKLSYFPPRRRGSARRISLRLEEEGERADLIDFSTGELVPEEGPRSPGGVPGREGSGVRSLRPVEEEDFGGREVGRVVGEVVRGVETAGGVVEGWVRNWAGKARREGGEIFEMVATGLRDDAVQGVNGEGQRVNGDANGVGMGTERERREGGRRREAGKMKDRDV